MAGLSTTTSLSGLRPTARLSLSKAISLITAALNFSKSFGITSSPEYPRYESAQGSQAALLRHPYRNNRDIVDSSGRARGRDETGGDFGRRPFPRQHLLKLRVADHLGQPVGGQEQDIPVKKRVIRDINRDILLDPQGPGQYILKIGFCRILRADRALAHLLRHQGMILG